MSGENRDAFVALVNVRQLMSRRNSRRRRTRRKRLIWRRVTLAAAALLCAEIGALIALAALIHG